MNLKYTFDPTSIDKGLKWNEVPIPRFSPSSNDHFINQSKKLNNEFRALVEGFIRNSPEFHFIDKNYIMALERDCFRTRTTKYSEIPMLLSDDDQIRENRSYDYDSDEITRFREEDLDMLLTIISSKFCFKDERDAVFTTYFMVRLVANDYFYDKAKSVYGNTFDTANSIEDYVRIFCDELLVDTSDRKEQGLLAFYLIGKQIFRDGNNVNFINCVLEIEKYINIHMQEKKLRNYEGNLLKPIHKQTTEIDNIDLMSGYEFEDFVARLFSKMGYTTTVTPKSGDQGIDVIAERDGVKIGIQAKCYQGQIDNSAIQQVTAGIKYHNCQKSLVITNRTFTKSAIDLAMRNDVLLWDRSVLKEKIIEHMQ